MDLAFDEMLAFRHDLTEVHWNHYANMTAPDSGFALSEVYFKDFRAWCDANFYLVNGYALN